MKILIGLFLYCTLILSACNTSNLVASNAANNYHDNTGRTDIFAGGIQMIPIQTVKGTFNVFGINNNGQGILPQQLQDPNNSKTSASAFSSLDFGAVPGYAYANRIKNWQFSGWIGLGAVVQAKVYTFQNNTNGYLGLAPRYDIRFITGYSNADYFIYFVTDFDNKSIRFNDLVYRQYYYSLKLVGGIRFDHPKVKVPKEKKQL